MRAWGDKESRGSGGQGVTLNASRTAYISSSGAQGIIQPRRLCRSHRERRTTRSSQTPCSQTARSSQLLTAGLNQGSKKQAGQRRRLAAQGPHPVAGRISCWGTQDKAAATSQPQESDEELARKRHCGQLKEIHTGAGAGPPALRGALRNDEEIQGGCLRVMREGSFIQGNVRKGDKMEKTGGRDTGTGGVMETV